MSIFSDNLKRFRKKRGVSQQKLGQAVGKSRDAVAKYECGENEPDIQTLINLSRYYGLPVDSMITSDEYVVFKNHPGLAEFEKHLNDPDFIPYFRLAAKIMDYGIDVRDMDNYAEAMVRYANQSRKAKKRS
ncbi:transcriptional regulator with XRE-family HTH domain [Anaerobacterium chartisolvens]|uniref:Transcriptional regulator with XRE-family HTH domain n=1 Tax=Anaerobacterium chartisolvens TaxID=1297424 RepID=A0A369BEY1_9FIRM|nr:helix-turn-helix transcriptional regulator [Anaerobacterium chartisolvens]RCX19981.1 transcriptional regulator with XRE-family HTH domain [Anaerobacterium chartisolvens]